MGDNYLRYKIRYLVRQLRQKAVASATMAQNDPDPVVRAEHASLYQVRVQLAEDLEALVGKPTVRK